MSFSKTVPIQLGGKTRSLKYGFNALVDLQESYGVDLQNMKRVLEQGGRLKDIRTIIWAGLRHEDSALTPEAVGDMFETPEDLISAAEAVRAAMEAAFPPTKADGKKAAPKN